MNLNEKLLTAEQSAKLAGVSIETIKKYTEIGLLDIKRQGENELYYENDIKTLFYSQLKAKVSTPSSETAPTSTTTNTSNTEATPSLDPQKLEPKMENKTSSDNVILDAATNANAETESTEPKLEKNTTLVSPDSYYPSSIELIEINKSLREQIKILREDRDWLRERVEKLEARSEREQMLLLSESENLRTLIKSTRKTSFWEKALPWFGKGE